MNPKAISLETITPDGIFAGFSISARDLEERLRERGVEGVRVAGDFTADATLSKSGPDVFVVGHFRVALKMACVRCLDGFGLTVEEAVHLDLSTEPLGFEDTTGEFELSPAELEVNRLEGNELDLEEVFIGELLLAIPEYPLCAEKCKGLCPLCGKKVEAEVCGCGETRVDPRFSALQSFKPKKQS